MSLMTRRDKPYTRLGLTRKVRETLDSDPEGEGALISATAATRRRPRVRGPS
jgi:hypothetical protein